MALTRAKDELIVTRHCPSANGGYTSWSYADRSPEQEKPETYFFNSLPEGILINNLHQLLSSFIRADAYAPNANDNFSVGIRID